MKIFLILASISVLSGCSFLPQSHVSVDNESTTAQFPDASNTGEEKVVLHQLNEQLSYWKGTPFRLGGNSKKGIDCSAFVQNVYRDSFNVTLPRTTEVQANKGYFVYKDQLQVGDLVFFKTGWRTRHVGIYIGKNKFIHASTSKGVITSSLNNVYWKDRYWQSRRLLD